MRWLGYAIEDDGHGATSVEELERLLDPPRPKSAIPIIAEISLPTGFKCCYDNLDSVYTREIGKMALRKNLEPGDLINAGVGFTRDDAKWEPFAIFPVLEYERIVYFQGRTYWDDPGCSTKCFPSRQEAPLSSKYWIYNIDALENLAVEIVVVVESILNVLSLQKKFVLEGVTNVVPVCVFKHAVSKPQFYKLLRYKHLKEVCMLFDFDAIDISWQDAKKIDDLIPVTIAEMPLDEKNLKLDANDDVKAAWKALHTRRQYLLSNLLDRNIQATELLHRMLYRGDQLDDKMHPISPLPILSSIRAV